MKYTIVEHYLTPNIFTRSRRRIRRVNALVVHWTGSPGGTNTGLYRWFNETSPAEGRYGSAHYGIDAQSIFAFIPEEEVAYHVGSKSYTDYAKRRFCDQYPNEYSLGVELNPINAEGYFQDEVLDRAVDLFAALCDRYDLDPMHDIIRHYDVTGKLCPKIFVDAEAEFEAFKERIENLWEKSVDTIPGG
jgi:N-acetylmuramoyl-L-alanine amidase